jgi:hypothetical protein
MAVQVISVEYERRFIMRTPWALQGNAHGPAQSATGVAAFSVVGKNGATQFYRLDFAI